MAEWTPNQLKEHIDARFEALDAHLATRDANFEKRMDGTNEWRGALQDLQTKQASKEALELLADRVKKLEDVNIKSGGGTDRFNRLGAMLVQAVATAVAVAGVLQLLG